MLHKRGENEKGHEKSCNILLVKAVSEHVGITNIYDYF